MYRYLKSEFICCNSNSEGGRGALEKKLENNSSVGEEVKIVLR